MKRIVIISLCVSFISIFFITDAEAYYNPKLGRFLSRDPIKANPKVPSPADGYQDGMNLYRANFVPNKVDPFGLQPPSGGVPYPGPGPAQTPAEAGAGAFGLLADLFSFAGEWYSVSDSQRVTNECLEETNTALSSLLNVHYKCCNVPDGVAQNISASFHSWQPENSSYLHDVGYLQHAGDTASAPFGVGESHPCWGWEIAPSTLPPCEEKDCSTTECTEYWNNIEPCTCP